MSCYQGHVADGSSIQAHSIGTDYPFVTQLRDARGDGGPLLVMGGGYHWEVLLPGSSDVLRFDSHEQQSAAIRRLIAVRDNEDAWAFELERLCTLAGQKLSIMHGARLALGDPVEWSQMSKIRRVAVLLSLGKTRNALKLPPGTNEPDFANFARRIVQ